VNPLLEALAALLPPVGVGLIFWFVIRAIIHADRRERIALARLHDDESRSATVKRAGDSAGTDEK
jgi:hypothetical protein